LGTHKTLKNKMQKVFSGKMYSYCSEAYFMELGADIDLDYRKNQTNGLCGSAASDQLVLKFGVHTGEVNLSIWLTTEAEPIDESWDEIVEVPFQVTRDIKFNLVDFNGDPWGNSIPLRAGNYRIRYSAKNFHATEEKSSVEEVDSSLLECYELIIWPSEINSDEIIKNTNLSAASWHSAN
jgi:hypothetical protein